MNNEPINGWTFYTLKEYFEALIASRDQQYSQRYETSQESVKTAFAALSESTRTAMAAADKAVLKAEAASEKRFESVNEFRGLVTDQQRTFMPRAEAEQIMSNMDKKIEEVKTKISGLMDERKGAHDGTLYLIAIGGFIFSILFNAFLFLRK
jgi:hypothetical protein